jgi:hypothetical protein
MFDSLVEAQIKQDLLEQFGREYWFAYNGTHNGFVAIFIPREEGAVKIIEVAGITFGSGSLWMLLLWKDGSFLSMPDAYAQGILTAENIKAIAEFHAEFIKTLEIKIQNGA